MLTRSLHLKTQKEFARVCYASDFCITLTQLNEWNEMQIAAYERRCRN